MGFTLGWATAETRTHQILDYNLAGVTFICGELGAHVPPVQGDEGPAVAHGVAVVGSTEHCDALPIMHHLVTFLLEMQ